MVPASPIRLVAATLGAVVALIPALSNTLGVVQALALACTLLSAATAVVALAGLPTIVASMGIAETVIVTLRHGGPAVVLAEALAVLAYLLVADPAGALPRDGERDVPSHFVMSTVTVFVTGAAATGAVWALGFAVAGAGLALAVLGVAAAVASVAVVRWLLES